MKRQVLQKIIAVVVVIGSFVAHAEIPPVAISSIVTSNGQFIINWTGGRANFQVQTASNLSDSLNMIENGQWVTNKIVTLYGRDAGTDSGVTFASPDQVTVPRGAVTAFAGFPALQDGVIVPFGAFTFTRLD